MGSLAIPPLAEATILLLPQVYYVNAGKQEKRKAIFLLPNTRGVLYSR